jgi:hypothetical protein
LLPLSIDAGFALPISRATSSEFEQHKDKHDNVHIYTSFRTDIGARIFGSELRKSDPRPMNLAPRIHERPLGSESQQDCTNRMSFSAAYFPLTFGRDQCAVEIALPDLVISERGRDAS